MDANIGGDRGTRGQEPALQILYVEKVRGGRSPLYKFSMSEGLGVVKEGLGVVKEGLGVVKEGLGVVTKGLGVDLPAIQEFE